MATPTTSGQTTTNLVDGKKAKSRSNHSRHGIVLFLADHRAFTKLAYEWLQSILPGSQIEYQDVKHEIMPAIKKIQELLEAPRARSRRAQALEDLSGFHQICYDFVNKTLANIGSKSTQKSRKTIDGSVVNLIRSSIEIIKRTVSNRPEQRKFAILRLQLAAELADVWFGEALQNVGNVRDELKKISSEELLLAVAEKEEIPVPKRQFVCTEVMRCFKKAKSKTLKEDDAWRPKWSARPEPLKSLTAPLFLKKVWADLFDKEGNIVDEARIRNYDSKLIQVVQQYISKRVERGQDLGDATGILLTNKGWNGPSRTLRDVPPSPGKLKHTAP